MEKINELISYLPSVVSEIGKVSELMSISQVEIDGLWSDLNVVLDSQFVNLADEVSISRYETFLGILPKSGSSLSERRENILTTLAIGLPYTFANLELQLKNICGDDGIVIQVYPDEYLLYVRVSLEMRSKYDSAYQLICRMMPANLELDMSLGYNNYGGLSALTHGEMDSMTYYDVKNAVLEVSSY